MTQLNDVPMHRIHAAQSIARELDQFVDRHPRALVGELRPLIDQLSRTLHDGPQGARPKSPPGRGFWTLNFAGRAVTIHGAVDMQPQMVLDEMRRRLPSFVREHVTLMQADPATAVRDFSGRDGPSVRESVQVHVVSDGHPSVDGSAVLTFRSHGHRELDEREVRVSSNGAPDGRLGRHVAPRGLWLPHLLALAEAWEYEVVGTATTTGGDGGAPLAIVPIRRDGRNGFVWAQQE